MKDYTVLVRVQPDGYVEANLIEELQDMPSVYKPTKTYMQLGRIFGRDYNLYDMRVQDVEHGKALYDYLFKRIRDLGTGNDTYDPKISLATVSQQ